MSEQSGREEQERPDLLQIVADQQRDLHRLVTCFEKMIEVGHRLAARIEALERGRAGGSG